MLLLELRDYIRERKHVSLRDLALHFDSDPEVVRAMLDKWIKKGRVRKCSTAACGGCASNCSTAQAEEAYEWVETPTRFIPIKAETQDTTS